VAKQIKLEGANAGMIDVNEPKEKRTLNHCDKTGCLNHCKIMLVISSDGQAYDLLIKATYFRDVKNPLGILITCLFCEHCEKTDMFMAINQAVSLETTNN
jgi:hypothetical protein